MKILKEDVFGISDFLLEGELDFSDKVIDDALVKSINQCVYTVENLPFDKTETMLRLIVRSEITYLDAKTLEEIILNVDFDEDIPFSFEKEQAEELDIDFFAEELNLELLIYELIMVNIPFNYSENINDKVLSEEVFYDEGNQPFAKIFKKEE